VGGSIVGFDEYHYTYESGREGDAPLTEFSPRTGELVLYLGLGVADADLLPKPGKHKTGTACLYIKKLDDIDRHVLPGAGRALGGGDAEALPAHVRRHLTSSYNLP
jgi:hypothetical protein